LGSGCVEDIPISYRNSIPSPETTWRLKRYHDLDHFLRSNFPLGAKETQLLQWLEEFAFSPKEFGYLSFSFESDEAAKDQIEFRRINNLPLWGAQATSHKSFLGDVRHRVTWRVDDCGNILELHASHRYFWPLSK